MEEHNIPYFRNLWEYNDKCLQSQIEVWEKILKSTSVPDEVLGDIRTNIGLARLLMNQKLKQFKGLIDDSEFNTGEKEITSLDLQGFWDMVYNEVEKIMNCFSRLEKCKENGWNFEVEDSVKRAEKKVPVKRDVAAVKKDDASKFRALAAKQRLAEAKKKMLALREQQKPKHFVDVININNSDAVKSKNINMKANGDLFNEESNIVSIKKESIDNLEQNLNIDENHGSSVKTYDQGDVKEKKHKASLQKTFSPVRDKENFEPCDKESNTKHLSKARISKEKGEQSAKKRNKSKDYGVLQCLTRSAKKALLQQNPKQEL